VRHSTPPPERPTSEGDGDQFAAGGLEELVRRMAELSLRNEHLLRRLFADERRFRGLAKAVWKVQEDERRRLALELHDGIGQTLTALINHLRRLQQHAGATAPGLAQGIELAELALDDVRELSRLLRPAVLDDLGLRAAISWLMRMLRERAGLTTVLEWRLEPDVGLDPEVETLIFRVLQEGLNNVVKHSGQGEAQVSIAGGNAGLQLEIADSGHGFDPAMALKSSGGAGVGLRGIRDRVELFGGRFTIESSPGRGSRLRVTLPLGEALS
jgi:two-component system, NarL family, sensor kinase